MTIISSKTKTCHTALQPYCHHAKEGDYIELGQLGAYGLTFRTNFNGFFSNEIFEVNDKPIMSSYEESNEKVDSLVA